MATITTGKGSVSPLSSKAQGSNGAPDYGACRTTDEVWALYEKNPDTFSAAKSRVDSLVSQLRQEAQAAKSAQKDLTYKVGVSGAVSLYGLQAMPVTLYRSQWHRLRDNFDALMTFVDNNDAESLHLIDDTGLSAQAAKAVSQRVESLRKLIAKNGNKLPANLRYCDKDGADCSESQATHIAARQSLDS